MTKSISTKPVIVIVDNSIAVTGALKSIINSACYLAQEFEFILVLPKYSLAKDYVVDQGFTVYELPFVEIGKSLKKLLMYFPYLIFNSFKLKRIVSNHAAKIIHMNDFYNMTGLGANLLGANAVLITHVRFLPDKFMPALSRTWAWLNLQFSHKIVCVSEAVKKFFPDSEKVIIIYDSAPILEKYPDKVISKKEEIQLLYLSNFIPGKGQEYALEAFEIAYKTNKKLRLLFVGGDMGLSKNMEFKKQLELEVSTKCLEDQISFSSFVSDVEKIIKDSDIVLNFSESESFSLTCLDALYYGTPLIASDSGGPAELFENGNSGILVPNKDVVLMAQSILNLASDLDRRKMFAANGKKYVRNKFSIEKNCFQLKEVYSSFMFVFLLLNHAVV